MVKLNADKSEIVMKCGVHGELQKKDCYHNFTKRSYNQYKCKECKKRVYIQNKDKIDQRAYEWKKNNRDAINKGERKAIKELKNHYIKRLLVDWHGYKREDITPELITAYRAILILKRLIKEKKKYAIS